MKKDILIPQKSKDHLEGYYEKIHTTKLNKLEEKENFLEIYHLPRPNNEKKIENLNRSVTSKKTELLIKVSAMKKILESGDFTAEFYQTFKEDTNPSQILPKKSKRKEHSQMHFRRPALS